MLNEESLEKVRKYGPFVFVNAYSNGFLYVKQEKFNLFEAMEGVENLVSNILKSNQNIRKNDFFIDILFPGMISSNFYIDDELLASEVNSQQESSSKEISKYAKSLEDLNINAEVVKAPNYSNSSAMFFKFAKVSYNGISSGTQIWISNPYYQGPFNNHKFDGKVFNDKLVIHQQSNV